MEWFTSKHIHVPLTAQSKIRPKRLGAGTVARGFLQTLHLTQFSDLCLLEPLKTIYYFTSFHNVVLLCVGLSHTFHYDVLMVVVTKRLIVKRLRLFEALYVGRKLAKESRKVSAVQISEA